MYVLEAQMYIRDRQEAERKRGCFEHVGYVDILFRTKNKAAEHYDAARHPNMRALNAHNTYTSVSLLAGCGT